MKIVTLSIHQMLPRLTTKNWYSNPFYSFIFSLEPTNFVNYFFVELICIMQLLIENIDQLLDAAEQLIQYAGNRKKWCFYGEMGAGKTTFIKAIGQQFPLIDGVTSPTYSLINEYAYGEENAQVLYHLDLYRLKTLEEAMDIGIEDYLYNDNYCLIEWPQIIEQILPDDVLNIKLEILSDGQRQITLN